jgi:hypothetical protein
MQCGGQNDDRQVRCGICGAVLSAAAGGKVVVECQCGQTYYATEKQTGKSLRCSCGKVLVVGEVPVGNRPSAAPGIQAHAPSSARPALASISIGVALLCGVLLAGDVAYQAFAWSRLQVRLREERTTAQQQHADTVQQELAASAKETKSEEAAHQARLQNQDFISGVLAQHQHEVEWARRLAHDPTVARSAMERTLLQMEEVGHDPARTARQALGEVARLAAPRGSRIEVNPSGDRFAVKVAFRMSALSANETGAVTKHHDTESMRREIRSLSAGLMKSLFDYCGSRGIETLTVTCNHAMRRTIIPQNATASEKQELLGRAPVVIGRLYRVSLDQQHARSVADWRRISVPQVGAIMTVELDELKTLQISGTSYSQEQDPEGQLEF